MDIKDIIERVKRIHGEKYDLSFLTSAKVSDKVRVVCPIHGEFNPRLNHFLQGSGCPKCSGKIRKTFDEFKAKANDIHGGKYTYNDSNYINSHTKIGITCPIHGVFYQTPTNHLNGNGCPMCKTEKLVEKNSSCIEDFIEKANIRHSNKYDYSQSVYANNHTPILIICPIHGEFWQTPNNHLRGRGCPKCNESKMEREIRQLLDKHNVEYVYQWHLPWSKYYSLDFYIPSKRVAIECQGGQHFGPIEHFGGEEEFKVTKERDERKRMLCNENGIKVLYYSNIADSGCISDKDELLCYVL